VSIYSYTQKVFFTSHSLTCYWLTWLAHDPQDDVSGSEGEETGAPIDPNNEYEDMEGFIDDEELEDQAKRRKKSTGHNASDFHVALGGAPPSLSESRMSADDSMSRDNIAEAFEMSQKRKGQSISEETQEALDNLKIHASKFEGFKKVPHDLDEHLMSCANAMKKDIGGGFLTKAHYDMMLNATSLDLKGNQAIKNRVKDLRDKASSDNYLKVLEDATSALRVQIRESVEAQKENKLAIEAEATRIKGVNRVLASTTPAATAPVTEGTTDPASKVFVPAPGGGLLKPPSPNKIVPGATANTEELPTQEAQPITITGADDGATPSAAPAAAKAAVPKAQKVPTFKFKWSKALEDAFGDVMLIECEQVNVKVTKALRSSAKKEDTAEEKEKNKKKEHLKEMTTLYKKWTQEWPEDWLVWTDLRTVHQRFIRNNEKAKAKAEQKEKEQLGGVIVGTMGAPPAKRKMSDIGSAQKEKKQKGGSGGETTKEVPGGEAPAISTATSGDASVSSSTKVLNNGAKVGEPRMSSDFDPMPLSVLERWREMGTIDAGWPNSVASKSPSKARLQEHKTDSPNANAT